jgi:hypothetical protein
MWKEDRYEKHNIWKNSEEAKKLFSDYSKNKKGIKLPEDHKNNIKKSFSEERKKSISESKRNFYESSEGKKVKEALAVNASKRFLGASKSEEHKKNISKALTGKEHHWQDKINKNREKIQKTADIHRGMKRSDEAKKKMSDAKKGKVPHNIGKKYYYNPDNPSDKVLCLPDSAPTGWINGIYKKRKI